MKQLLINYRDYCYQELRVQKGEQHAEESYQFLFGVSFYGYYATFLSILAIIQWQLTIPIPTVFKHNFLVILTSAVLMHLPFYYLTNWLLKLLSPFPLQREISRSQLLSWRWRAIAFWILGWVLLFLMPWGLTELLR